MNPIRANYLLGGIENIEVARWLSPNDPAATAALAKPTLTLTVTAKQVNDQGQETGTVRRTLQLAPQPDTGAFYGRLEGERYLFLLDAATHDKLAVDPLDPR